MICLIPNTISLSENPARDALLQLQPSGALSFLRDLLLRPINPTPHVVANLTGVFEGKAYNLVPHSNGVISLQFTEPLSWTVPGHVDSFYSSVRGSINNDAVDATLLQQQQR